MFYHFFSSCISIFVFLFVSTIFFFSCSFKFHVLPLALFLIFNFYFPLFLSCYHCFLKDICFYITFHVLSLSCTLFIFTILFFLTNRFVFFIDVPLSLICFYLCLAFDVHFLKSFSSTISFYDGFSPFALDLFYTHFISTFLLFFPNFYLFLL